MFPHPETVFVVRDMERRLHLDRIAREQAMLIEVTRPATRNERIAHRLLARLPLAWLAALVGLPQGDNRAPRLAPGDAVESKRHQSV